MKKLEEITNSHKGKVLSFTNGVKVSIKITLLTFLLLAGCRLADTTGPGTTTPYLYHIGGLNTPGYAYAVDASENHVYVADGVSGLRIIDITTPNFPNHVDFYEDNGRYYDVKYSGSDYVYVAAGEAGFKIIDVKSPFGPELVGEFPTTNAFGLDYAGQFIYLADWIGGVRILDISSHFHIMQVSSFHVSGQNVNNVTIQWPYLYVSSSHGFSIVDVAEPFSPNEIHFESLNNVYDIAIANHFAYVAFEGGLRIYDVSDPVRPIARSMVDLPGTGRSVSVSGAFAYVAIGSNGLSVIRITNPDQPSQVAYHNPVAGEMSDVHLFGYYLLVANGNAGLLILEFWPGR